MRNQGGNLNLVLLLLVFLLPRIISADAARQHKWSGSSGVLGPVPYWTGDYYNCSQTSGTSMTGKLIMDVLKIYHVISSDMPGCYHAFPGDMDGDGDVDVLAQSIDYDDIDWFENDGSGGGWDIHVVSENIPSPRCAYPVDIDCDGDMDIVEANSSIASKGILWWRNDDGVGDSWTRFYVDEGYGQPGFVCCADINGNDTLDIISPDGDHTIAWWEGAYYPPDSMWDKHVVSGGIDDGWELFPVDLDQDGDMDILSAAESWHGLNWFENADGIGLIWTEHEIGDYYSIANSAYAAFIDSDTYMDVVYCNDESGEVSWFENVDGSCTNWEEHVLTTSYDRPQGVHAADFTDDGYVDIIVATYEDHKLYLWRNVDGTGSQWAVYQLSSGSWWRDVDSADFNGDGRTDVLAVASIGLNLAWHEVFSYDSGWLESSILDVGGYPQWDSITWVSEEPPGTDIFFQARTSNVWEDMGAWCDTIFDPGSLEGYIDSTHRYIQYRVSLLSDSAFATPILDEVRFWWSNLGIGGSTETAEFTVRAFPNPSRGSVSIYVPSVFLEDAEILVYDISGKLVRKLSDSDGSVFLWDCRDGSGNVLPSGIYIVQGMVEERRTSVRFVKI
jgi:hypothetical protein